LAKAAAAVAKMRIEIRNRLKNHRFILEITPLPSGID